VRDDNPIAADIQRLQIPVDIVPISHLRDVSGCWRLLQYLRRQQPDLIHTQLEFSDTLGSLLANFLGIPTISTLHTLDAPDPGTRTYWRLRLRWWSLRRFAKRVVAVSEGTRQHHLRVGQLGPDKVVTLYNGIDLLRFNGHRQVQQIFKEDFGIPATAPLLTTVAVLRPAKGIQYMIEALPTILEAVPQTYYLVVGAGEHEQSLKALVKEKGLTERVIFTGVRNDVPDLLALSDVFVLPTLDEALPTVLAEAMAAEKPIVVSAVGGVPEMVTDGANGFLVPPADPARLAVACIQLLQHPDQAQAMARIGRDIVEQRFNIRNQARRLGDLYQEVLAEQKR
jgi:glycosyltransferase involved in cell wall biosynthesis